MDILFFTELLKTVAIDQLAQAGQKESKSPAKSSFQEPSVGTPIKPEQNILGTQSLQAFYERKVSLPREMRGRG